jgi:hypothetical protein
LSTGAENTDYLLDNADPRAVRRFDALGDLFDARTIEYLTALGVTRGWSCWEVGAGGNPVLSPSTATTAKARNRYPPNRH